MSFGCSWEPLAPPPPANHVPVGFKYAVAQNWFGHDGSLRGEVELDGADVNYLRGLRDGGTGDVSEGAAMLIDAINAHGCIIFKIGP